MKSSPSTQKPNTSATLFRAYRQLRESDVTDPLLQGMAATSDEQLTESLAQAFRANPSILLGQALLIELLKKAGIAGFSPAEASVDLIAICSRPDELRLDFDFRFREMPTPACRQGRTLDGEALVVFLPRRESILHVNFAQIDRDDTPVAMPVARNCSRTNGGDSRAATPSSPATNENYPVNRFTPPNEITAST